MAASRGTLSLYKHSRRAISWPQGGHAAILPPPQSALNMASSFSSATPNLQLFYQDPFSLLLRKYEFCLDNTWHQIFDIHRRMSCRCYPNNCLSETDHVSIKFQKNFFSLFKKLTLPNKWINNNIQNKRLCILIWKPIFAY